MSRYIDATHLPNFEVMFSNGKKVLLLPYEHLSDIPTADVVEVVRCKDCKWFQKENDRWQQHCRLNGFAIEKDDYCSFAEKALKEREKK